MKKISILSKTILLCSFSLLFTTNGISQHGYSNASVAMGQMRSNSFQVPSPNEIRIDEYVNYHTHNIPLPEKGKSVNMDLRFGSEDFSPYSKEAILQIGLTTPHIQTQEAPPINVSLVIDKSGSMSGDRIQYARMAAIEFVKRLRDEDIVSIITFDHNINVVLPAQSAKNKNRIIEVINGIYPGGSTNLNDGLITGYKEVVKNYSKKINNRVLMLTDALTNTGQIDPEVIVSNSMNITEDMDIDITVIGVGVDFNNDLSRQITSSSKSSIHFIYDAKDIKKVFIDEIESLLSPVAKEVKLVVELPTGMTFKKVYGYAPAFDDNKLNLTLNNMNNGLTQVIVITCELDKNIKKQNEVKAKLEFYDIVKKNTQTINTSITLKFNDENLLVPDLLEDDEVRKNYTIARLAYGLKNMAIAMQSNNHSEARTAISRSLDEARSRFPNGFDKDIQRIADILTTYDQQIVTLKQ